MGTSSFSCKYCGAGNVAIRGDDDYENCFWACGNCRDCFRSGDVTLDVDQEELLELRETVDNLISDRATLQQEIYRLNTERDRLIQRVEHLENSAPINPVTHKKLQKKLALALANCERYKQNINNFTASLHSGIK